MDATRLALRGGPILVGVLWAAVLVILGLALLAPPPPAGRALRSMGVGRALPRLLPWQFVFMVIVADRIIPPRKPALAFVAEGAAALATLAAAAALVLTLIRSAGA